MRFCRGSPPHTRGIPEVSSPGRFGLGFTPAYAGNTSPRLAPSTAQQVHPRIRGEYRSWQLQLWNSKGSPPHTRGILKVPLAMLVETGFTPAYAGNTLKHLTGVFSQGVHPRIRGEYFRLCVVIRVDTGSPPHTRGIPWIIFKAPAAVRFTPAYAGNTSDVRRIHFRLQVHPRIRGEYPWCSR